uniref:DUF1801 domain-containing protein n=1 Tax=Gelidibacter sp. TaxID=2018083 RepID=UPI00404904FD
MNTDIQQYISNLEHKADRDICFELQDLIDTNLTFTESKIWHAHPVWFINGNPIVGFSKLKHHVRLMFWSGQSFDEDKLNSRGEKFKDAAINYTDVEQVNTEDLKRWLKKAETIQWDYKNIVKRKGQLERLM